MGDESWRRRNTKIDSFPLLQLDSHVGIGECNKSSPHDPHSSVDERFVDWIQLKQINSRVSLLLMTLV